MLTKSLAVNQLGGDIVFAVDLTDFINSQDVGMIERGSGFCFLNKTIQFVFIFTEFVVKEFDRHLPIEFSVLRQIHLAHSARSDLRDDAVMRKRSVSFEFFIQSHSGRFIRFSIALNRGSERTSSSSGATA